MTPPPGRPGDAQPRPAAPVQLRLTRRGLARCVQLAVTAGVLGTAGVSCGALELRSGSGPVAAGDGAGADGAGTGGGAPAGAGTAGGAPDGGAPDGGSPTGLLAQGSGPRPAAGSIPSATPSPSTPGPSTAPATTPGAVSGAAPAAAPGSLPGVGPGWAAQLAGHDQVVLVSGPAMTAVHNIVRAYDRTATGWTLRAQAAGWNGRGGWAVKHTVGDLRSPTGMYALTDAGGYAGNPGTALPYQFSPAAYSMMINGVRTFNHVLAIDYNRVDGSPPSDTRRPQGWSHGGSIWIHVEHDSPTQACIGIADTDLVALLRWLRPASHPVILMGPASVLAT